jgi:hypothetical protein
MATSLNFEQSPLLASLHGLVPQPDADVRRALCGQLIKALDQYYAHLPQKRAGFAIDPVRQLQLLQASDGRGFLRTVLRIISGLRDRHTTLTLAQPWTSLVAYVPFILERFYENGQPRYVVTKQLFGFEELPVGTEVTHWNGVPLERYVQTLAATNQGANWGAQIQLAVSNLTVQPLSFMLMPQEDWVTLSYIDSKGGLRALTTPWRFFSTAAAATGRSGVSRGGILQGIDELTQMTNDFRRTTQTRSNLTSPSLETEGFVRYGVLKAGGRKSGYLRITSFNVPDADAFIQRMEQILAGLPQDRLVIDVRGNPGGLIPAGQRLVRLLTTKPVVHSPIAFRNTASILELCTIRRDWFEPWIPSLQVQLQTGEQFSQALPIVPVTDGSRYHYPGKVVLITDGLCYSTTDFFAADFRDNGIGTIVGVDDATGGGGANVVGWNFLAQEMGATNPGQMPPGYDFNIALRRSLRTGASHGIPVEDLGVPADIRYRMTRADVLENNQDLLAFASTL